MSCGMLANETTINYQLTSKWEKKKASIGNRTTMRRPIPHDKP